ncbi:kinase-like domain-containing protein [Schizophyllum commune]
MDPSQPAQGPQPQPDANDVFHTTDKVLADKLQFIEEIGFGNWGSVWLCKPRHNPRAPGADELSRLQSSRMAVKLVHRKKDENEKRTAETAARVKSLWNEMKIVRSLKPDLHPSIVPFYSFVVTPSYALITMEYLPTLVPVEVAEPKARLWFKSLLSGVEYLHKRGIVHNDIKPANILLSEKNVPVLVDFGFAEQYRLESRKAFLSNISYGTPEYLSPERARGLPHDTRKSDVWSLGVTFFEILSGRTPFENSDTEQFSTTEELERYWARTLRGKWIGTWKMSRGMEKLLRRMMSPNADLRCTASAALEDPYWAADAHPHRRSASDNSIAYETPVKPVSWSKSSAAKENANSSPSLAESPSHRSLQRAKSQPKVAKVVPHRKRVPVELSPIKQSPPVSPSGSAAASLSSFMDRKPLQSRTGTASRNRLQNAASSNKLQNGPPTTPTGQKTNTKPARVLGDVTSARRNVENTSGNTSGVLSASGMLNASASGNVSGVLGTSTAHNTENGSSPKRREHPQHERTQHEKKGSVKDRMREWEREKERLREMARLEELERERDEQIQEEKKEKEMLGIGEFGQGESDKENEGERAKSNPNETFIFSEGDDDALNIISQSFAAAAEPIFIRRHSRKPSDSAFHSLTHSFRRSIDRTFRFGSSKNTSALTLDSDDFEPRGRQSEEDDVFGSAANSSLPVVKNALASERVAADNHTDRMTIWMRNVEKVVQDAKLKFEAERVEPLPPMPLSPASRSGSTHYTQRSSRVPRKIPAAYQIFADGPEDGAANTNTNTKRNSLATSMASMAASAPGHSQTVNERSRSVLVVPEIVTPSRQRRATVSETMDQVNESPLSRKEKSRSQGDLFQRRIAPLAKLELELEREAVANQPQLSPKLADVLDRSVFVNTPELELHTSFEGRRHKSFDELTSSPLHVEPYPARQSRTPNPLPDTPCRKRVEQVYDRFLMSSSGVTRLGKGYQSDARRPVSNTVSSRGIKKTDHRVFASVRRVAMPPPVSSEDTSRVGSVDELGMHIGAGIGSTALKDETNKMGLSVRRALKNLVPGKTVSRRLSKIAA